MSNKSNTLPKLIEGTFSPQDAHDVLIQLINHKINFHNKDEFSSQVRGEVSTIDSVGRKKSLELLKDRVADIIQQARNEGKQLTITGTLDIQLNPS